LEIMIATINSAKNSALEAILFIYRADIKLEIFYNQIPHLAVPSLGLVKQIKV